MFCYVCVALLIAFALAEPEYPKFFSQNETVTVEAGSYVELLCNNATGDSPITYTWYTRFGEEIYGHKVRGSIYSRNEENGSSLVFDGIQEDEAGYYVCWATNQVGASRKFYTLIIEQSDPPSFDESFEQVSAEEGYSLDISCTAGGSPTPTLSWFDPNRDKIGTGWGSAMYVVASRNESRLIIRQPTRSHSGLYSCVANNTHGFLTKLYHIQVTSAGNETNNETQAIQYVRVMNVTDNSVQFDIRTNAPHYGDTQVRFSEKRENIPYTKQWRRGERFIVDKLLPSGYYYFEFRLVEGSNSSEWQMNTTAILLPGQPDVLIRGLKDEAFSIEWKTTFDDYMRDTIQKYSVSYYVMNQYGDKWNASDCAVTIDIPKCLRKSHTIADLVKNTVYEVQVKAHTSAGAGKPYSQKIVIRK